MTFKLINNLSSSNNHSTQLKKLFEHSESVLVASPFLMSEFSDFFGKLDLTTLKYLHIITTLKPNSFDQIKKINSLISLIEFPLIKDKKLNCQISLNNRLHGKVYIFKKNDTYISAIISSANFTDSGLSMNHEWGIEIYDTSEIEELEKSILANIEFPNLNPAKIYEMQQVSNDFMSTQPPLKATDIDLNLLEFLNIPDTNINIEIALDFWLKPIGVSDRPVTDDRLFDAIEDNLHFSKKRPNGVKPNDIIITYGVGSRKILSVYRATSYPIKVTAQEVEDDKRLERWPWFVNAHNLSPNFGATWPDNNLYIINESIN